MNNGMFGNRTDCVQFGHFDVGRFHAVISDLHQGRLLSIYPVHTIGADEMPAGVPSDGRQLTAPHPFSATLQKALCKSRWNPRHRIPALHQSMSAHNYVRY